MGIHRNFYKLTFIISHTSVYTEFNQSLLVLSMIALIVSVLQGCNKHPQDSDFTEAVDKTSVKLAVHTSQSSQIHSLDALVFNDDMLQRLDCYQRFENWSEGAHLIGSCSGKKIMLICANLKMDTNDWRQYNSFKKAGELKVELENEEREFPVMASCINIKAGESSQVKLERLSSEVELRSICCDFSGKPYAGENITEAKAYLINVNACSSLLPQEHESTERIINQGGLIKDDIEIFNDKSLIFSNLDTINLNRQFISKRFTCYHNACSEETIGSPFTKLVIEGKIQGETWFWPIDINRGNKGNGITRNSRYIYDITIRSKGTKDPDNTISNEMTDIIFKTEQWQEKDPYHVSF